MTTTRILALLTTILLLAGCRAPPGAPPAADGIASASGPLALAPDGRSLWVVAPDADAVTRVDTASLEADPPVAVGREPWAVAVAPGGRVVVMNRLGGSLSVLERGRVAAEIAVGAEPGGLALSPSGRLAWVTLSSSGEVIAVDLDARAVSERVAVGRMPWAVAVSDDGDADDLDERVVVTHRLARLAPDGAEARDDGKEGWLSVLEPAGSVRELPLPAYAFGFPNVLEGLAVAGGTAFVAHLLNSPELPRDFETTVSAALSTLPLEAGDGPSARALHLNDAAFSTPVNFPRAVAAAPDGATAYVVLSGTDAVMGIDLADPDAPRLIGFWPVGAAPRGIVLDRDGTRAYVMNHLSRDVSVLDLSDRRTRPELARVPVAPETPSGAMLRGRVLFNTARDPRLSRLGWVSCASCHPDGGSDGTTWITPEGRRQTMPLWNLAGTAPFHASASRDEVQDFEDDIETLMDGVGLAPGPARRLLGEPNGGVSADLDALALFVTTGVRVPRAASADFDPAAGRRVFEASGCAACHGGPAWTRSALPGPPGALAPNGELEVEAALHDVGTYDPAYDALGARGFDAPTLLGLHATAPYLHDGSAATLAEVLADERHAGAQLDDADTDALVAFLDSLDDRSAPVP